MYAFLNIVFIAAIYLIGTLAWKNKEDKSVQTLCIVLMIIVYIIIAIAVAPYKTYD